LSYRASNDLQGIDGAQIIRRLRPRTDVPVNASHRL
jgi:hypothetical protein